MKWRIITIIFLILTFFSLPFRVSTQAANDTVCQFAENDEGKCSGCMTDGQHVWTALGCVDISGEEFANKFLQLGIGIGGGVALLLIIFGALQIMISAGNPEKLAEGKELVTAAIAGLLFIIFSVFLLKLIGYDILRIPGFKG